MSNLITGIKKFLSNRNTVTVVGVLLGVLVLYIGYNMRVNQAITPISVPYATVTINPKTQITSDMIGMMQIPRSMVQNSSIYLTASEVVNKYSNFDSVIPAGSLFYRRAVVEKSALPDSLIREDYPDGYVLVNMTLNMTLSYGNQIIPGNYVDIYLKAINNLDENVANQKDTIMVGKLIENVKVLAVLDGNGQNVFDNVEEERTPAMMIFAVPEEYHILLRKTMYLRTYDATLLPVPTRESLKEQPGEVRISSEELRDWINNVTYWTEDMSGSGAIQ